MLFTIGVAIFVSATQVQVRQLQQLLFPGLSGLMRMATGFRTGVVARLGSARFRTEGGDVSALSPDGKTLALAGSKDIALLDTESGRSIARLPDTGSPCILVFLDRGKMLAALSKDGVVRFWSLISGKETAPSLAIGEQK